MTIIFIHFFLSRLNLSLLCPHSTLIPDNLHTNVHLSPIILLSFYLIFYGGWLFIFLEPLSMLKVVVFSIIIILFVFETILIFLQLLACIQQILPISIFSFYLFHYILSWIRICSFWFCTCDSLNRVIQLDCTW